jgi:hypothetical protein
VCLGIGLPCLLAACGGATGSQPVQRVVTATVTSEAALTVTATATVTVTVTTTVIERTTESPIGPLDVTPEYIAHAHAVSMPREQTSQIVQATLTTGILSVLTTMQPAWGGWDCSWEPATIAGSTVKYVRILYQDGSLFRLCD